MSISLTVGRATWLVLRRLENRDEEDEQPLARLIAQHPDLSELFFTRPWLFGSDRFEHHQK